MKDARKIAAAGKPVDGQADTLDVESRPDNHGVEGDRPRTGRHTLDTDSFRPGKHAYASNLTFDSETYATSTTDPSGGGLVP